MSTVDPNSGVSHPPPAVGTHGKHPIDYSPRQPGGHVHVVSPKILLSVYLGLVLLTVATVSVTRFDFGTLNVWVALLIALAKAGLVVMFFMHLRWDSPFNGIILLIALGFVVLFIGAAVSDSSHYKSTYEPPGNGQVMGGQFTGVRNGG